MKLNQWLAQATDKLSTAGIATARLDALVLLEDATGKDRSWLLAHSNFPCQGRTLTRLEEWVRRRSRHEPLAYIRGKSEFFGRTFKVTPDTLQPRPETETMIELLLRQVKSRKLKVESLVDVGTGSGCLAITAKLELPETNVYATDISEKCLQIAQKNAKRLQADIEFKQGNLLEPVSSINYSLSTIILANLPYVPDSFQINQAALFEPKLAIFGGEDGLDYYRQLFAQIDALPDKPSVVYTESLPPQHGDLRILADQHGYQLSATEDFIQVFECK